MEDERFARVSSLIDSLCVSKWGVADVACLPHSVSCVTGVEWYPGIDRNLLLDAQLCYDKRSEFVEQLGRRHECGFCLLECPRG